MAVTNKSISERCNGCGICVALCPQDVFRMDEIKHKAVIKYLEDCVACGICKPFCPRDCLDVTLERYKKAPPPC
jgi:NAD-dependent dihydropyrimidine dehydrogenase PreA subunit